MSALGDLHDDGELVAALGAAFETDLPEVPPDLARFARGAWQWIAIEGELARLSSDSLVDVRDGVRGSDDDERFLTFESPITTIELLVRSGLVVGRIQPEGTYEVIFVTPDDSLSVNSDVIGRFRAEISAPFRVTVRGTDATLTTEWITT